MLTQTLFSLRYRAFCPDIVFGKVFANFDACFLAAVPKSLEIEEILPPLLLLCFDKFCLYFDNLRNGGCICQGGVFLLKLLDELLLACQ